MSTLNGKSRMITIIKLSQKQRCRDQTHMCPVFLGRRIDDFHCPVRLPVLSLNLQMGQTDRQTGDFQCPVMF